MKIISLLLCTIIIGTAFSCNKKNELPGTVSFYISNAASQPYSGAYQISFQIYQEYRTPQSKSFYSPVKNMSYTTCNPFNDSAASFNLKDGKYIYEAYGSKTWTGEVQVVGGTCTIIALKY